MYAIVTKNLYYCISFQEKNNSIYNYTLSYFTKTQTLLNSVILTNKLYVQIRRLKHKKGC